MIAKGEKYLGSLNEKAYDIIFIQDSHSSPVVERIWETEWGQKSLYSHKDSKSRGVMILLKQSIDVSHTFEDSEGLLVMAEVVIRC